jgi:hypothetical protein
MTLERVRKQTIFEIGKSPSHASSRLLGKWIPSTLLSSIISRYVTKRRNLVTVPSCSETCVTASVKMIRFGYFRKDIKDEEKERARHEQDCTPVRGAMRQARNHANTPPRTTPQQGEGGV